MKPLPPGPLIAVLTFLPAAACTSLGPFCFAPSTVDSIDLVATPDANQDGATAVDVVFALDEPTEAILGQLDAATYFAGRRSSVLQNPSRAAVRSWEVAPGQTLRDRLDPPCGPAATYVFVGLRSPGEHRFELPSASDLEVVVTRDDVAVTTR